MRFKRIAYVVFLLGLAIFMYPHIHMILFEEQNRAAFSDYGNVIQLMDDKEIRKTLKEFEAYNEYIAEKREEPEYEDPFKAEEVREVKTEVVEESEVAEETEKVVRKVAAIEEAFGYLEIPKIRETLPIYLGASTGNLAKGVGQIEYTSLPIGGIGTHSVLAGHRGFSKGYPIFRHLDKLVPGDRFYIHVYNMTLTYEVESLEIILPTQTEKLDIDPSKDIVTLLTCTPYQSSAYRLLVYGIRVEGEGESKGRDKGILSVSATRESAEDAEVRNLRLLSYAIVGVGSVIWIIVLFRLVRTFRKESG